MATSTVSILLLLSLLAAAAAGTAQQEAPAAGLVGARTEIKDVGTNKLVQSLGRFAVQEHNRLLRHGGGGGAADPVPLQLAFTRVAAAQEQVVSGVAYYLKVIARDRAAAAAAGGGGDRPFDALVVVKAWLKSKELVSFTPSPK